MGKITNKTKKMYWVLLLTPYNLSFPYEHTLNFENDFPTHGSVILKKRMEKEHALFSFETLLERWKTLILHGIPVIVLAPN